MIPKRIIVHTENCESISLALSRAGMGITYYYKYKPKNDRRLTVRFDSQGVMAIYHDVSDVVLFSGGVE